MSSRRGLFPTGAEKSAESIQVAAHSGKITGLYQASCFLSSRPNASREIILRRVYVRHMMTSLESFCTNRDGGT